MDDSRKARRDFISSLDFMKFAKLNFITIFGRKANANSKSGLLIEVLILTALVLLNVMDFLGLLSPELDYIKKIISWTALGYILFKASISNVFFGKKYPFFDISIIIAMFSMVLKNFIHYARIVYDGLEGGGIAITEGAGIAIDQYQFMGYNVPSYLVRLYSFLVQNEQTILIYGFIFGFSVLALLALFAAIKVEVRSPSLLSALGIDGIPSSGLEHLKRFFINYFVYFAFFVVVFNLVMEWLAIAVDAPLLMVGLVFYFFSGNLGLNQKLDKLGNMGSDFYEDFMEHFKDKSMIAWGIAGMLVLHIITDIPNLLFPYIFGFSGILYSGSFDAVTIWEVAWNAIQVPGLLLLDQVLIGMGYLLNLIGLLLLMIAPGFIWYHVYKKSEFDLSPILIFIFVTSSVYYLLSPVFIISMVDSSTLIGVSMGFQELSPNLIFVFISFGVGLLFSLLALSDFMKKIIVAILTLGVQVFFIRHMYLYLVSYFNFYAETIVAAFSQFQFHIMFFMGVIGIFTLLFYSLGSLGYIVKTWK